MCGIAGIIHHQSLKQQEEKFSLLKNQLQQMAASLQHRGPDGEGVWINDNASVALVHRRLSIIDLSDAGQQPLHYLNKYTIIHNGEVYNYIELKEELHAKGYSFQSKTDTEVIVAAYDYWGEDCVQHFDGMFAFAIWDESKQELFAARDRFGEKPFFYFFDEKRFVFASEIKAIWAAGVEKVANQKMLFNYITIGYVDNPERKEETFFENIFKLPAGFSLKFSGIYFTYALKQYWDIDLNKINKDISDAEAIEKFSHLFSTAVKRRLRSDVAIGSSLSGGLDSSSVIATLSSLTTTAPTTFTASFPGYEKDELPYATQVAEQFHLPHYAVSVKGDQLVSDWQQLCYHQEEPFGSSSIYAQFKVFELAKEKNIKVLLDGQGADEILAGYHKYYKWYWQELFRTGKLSGRKELIAARALGITEPFTWKNKIAAWFPSFATVVMERQYLVKSLAHPDLTKEFIQHQSKEAYYTPPDYFNLNGLLYFNTCTHGLEELLRYADRNSMAHGREVRLPFLNHELVEFIFSLPSNFKIREGWTKWLLRKSMDMKLPASITWRKDKTGFEPPQKSWMEQKAVQEMMMNAKAVLVDKGILKKEVLTKQIKPHDAHAADYYDWRYLCSAMIF
jgi:asparagine synthase (glutamine-hydrolysing)